jgi:hypothetical protein
MKDLRVLDRWRVELPPIIADFWNVPTLGGSLAAICGAFVFLSPIDKRRLRVIASNGEGWDHVSVSLANRCPRWSEMEYVKRLFFHDHETAMQLHVPPADHISDHPYCLHLWRPHGTEIPRPPAIMVSDPRILEGAA